ncbi:Tos4p [Sporobolomyces salmoneus]|uniref:Tos4p n=1 Tax=Sporobolomyces salmoneus TaxID=183962 RepID=UPI0031704BF3
MLGDISNQLTSPKAPSKRSFVDSTAQNISSSSSSPSRLNGSSSPFFSNSCLDAFHASSSPAPPPQKLLSTPTKRSTLLDTLPPSSPSFGLEVAQPQSESHQSLLLADEQAEEESETVSLRLVPNTVLYFGRKAKKAIPRLRSPGYDPLERSIPILLPKSAKNASRIHCSARIVKSTSSSKKNGKNGKKGKVTIEVRVTGQNGMRIDGKLWKMGSLARFKVEDGRTLELAFWGWNAKVTVDASRQKEEEEEARIASRKRSLDSSSELGSLDDSEEENESEAAGQSAARPAKRSRQTSPSLSISSSSSSSVDSPAALRARSLASSPSLDLPGLLASTIVFHPRSTVGVDELVRALLKESGQQLWSVLSDNNNDRERFEQLKETREGEEEALRAWIPVCQEVLKGERMFGMIDNTGLKDAAGRPLPPYYYYIPDLDPSRSRVEALEPFVKRVRGARTSKPIRYFWAKPK